MSVNEGLDVYGSNQQSSMICSLHVKIDIYWKPLLQKLVSTTELKKLGDCNVLSQLRVYNSEK